MVLIIYDDEENNFLSGAVNIAYFVCVNLTCVAALGHRCVFLCIFIVSGSERVHMQRFIKIQLLFVKRARGRVLAVHHAPPPVLSKQSLSTLLARIFRLTITMILFYSADCVASCFFHFLLSLLFAS